MYVYIVVFPGFEFEGSAVIVASDQEKACTQLEDHFRQERFGKEGEENFHPDHPEVFSYSVVSKIKAATDEEPSLKYINYGGEGSR